MVKNALAAVIVGKGKYLVSGGKEEQKWIRRKISGDGHIIAFNRKVGSVDRSQMYERFSWTKKKATKMPLSLSYWKCDSTYLTGWLCGTVILLI